MHYQHCYLLLLKIRLKQYMLYFYPYIHYLMANDFYHYLNNHKQQQIVHI